MKKSVFWDVVTVVGIVLVIGIFASPWIHARYCHGCDWAWCAHNCK